MNRAINLDYLRTLAAYSVVIQHAVENTFPAFEEFGKSYFNFGLYGVVVFFLISGKVFSLYQWKGSAAFISNRTKRILPELALSFILLAVCGYAFGFSELSTRVNNCDSACWIANISLTNEVFGTPYLNGVTWTLPLEIAFYILILANHRSQYIILLFIFTVPIAIIAAVIADLNVPTGRLLLIYLSSAAFLRSEASTKSQTTLFTTLIWGALPIIFIYYSNDPHKNITPVATTLSWLAAIATFEVFSSAKLKYNTFVLNTSNITYSLYLTHPIVMWSILSYDISINSIAKILMIIIISSAVSFFITRFSDRIRKSSLFKFEIKSKSNNGG